MEASAVTTAIERKRAEGLHTVKPPSERPVFVAVGERRARSLRYAGAAAALACSLWLAALAIGMLGFGLPGVSLPSVGRAAEKPSTKHAEPTNSPSARVSEVAAAAAGPALQRHAAAESRRKVVRPARASRRAPTAKVSRPTRAHSAPQPSAPTQVAQPADPQPTPAPAPAQRGWAERGWTDPPGQTRRTEPTLPATATGQARGNGGEETTAPAEPAPPVPPGQQNKAENPPPKG